MIQKCYFCWYEEVNLFKHSDSVSCMQFITKSSEKTSNDTQPSWITNYPISETHYTGIGFADKSKHTTDYKVAKKTFTNLVSQIDVTYSEKSLFKLMNNDF